MKISVKDHFITVQQWQMFQTKYWYEVQPQDRCVWMNQRLISVNRDRWSEETKTKLVVNLWVTFISGVQTDWWGWCWRITWELISCCIFLKILICLASRKRQIVDVNSFPRLTHTLVSLQGNNTEKCSLFSKD